MTGIPEHQKAALRDLIKEGLPPEEIAFLMNTSRKIVEDEIARVQHGAPVNTTNQLPAEGEEPAEREVR